MRKLIRTILSLDKVLDRLDQICTNLYKQNNAIEDLSLRLIPEYRDAKHLMRYPVQVFSQNAEDSIISEIFQRITPKNKTFLEIGSGDGTENNTRLLLLQGWSGIWIEGNTEALQKAKKKFSSFIENKQLKIIQSLVTKENINSLLSSNDSSPPPSFDFISIDIDQNTSHIWRELTAKSLVSCIEYNASFHPSVEFEVPYHPHAIWDGSNIYGASLKSLESIGRQKEMSLVGCDYLGINAFFVSNETNLTKFRTPFTAETHYEPPRYGAKKHRGHRNIS